MNFKRYRQVRSKRLYQCVGKEQLEALKNLKKTEEPILTPEEKAS
jgi:hypothetical protein